MEETINANDFLIATGDSSITWTAVPTPPWYDLGSLDFDAPIKKGIEGVYLTKDALSLTEANEIQEIVDMLQEKGAFLHGSREKHKNDWVGDTETDWDFAVDAAQFGFIHNPFSNESPTDLAWAIETEFKTEKLPEYYDSSLKKVYVHKKWPHITIQVIDDFEDYKRLWKKLPTWYWEEYLWKSGYKMKEKFQDPEYKKEWIRHKQMTFAMLKEFMKPTLLEEFI